MTSSLRASYQTLDAQELSQNCSGFCNLSNISLHLENIGMVKTDIIIRYSLMASRLSLSIKFIVLRTVKAAFKVIMRKYAKILQWFTEIEWLPSLFVIAILIISLFCIALF